MPYAFPDAPQSIAIAQTCLFKYEIGKETVAGVTEFSRDNPHCLSTDGYPVYIPWYIDTPVIFFCAKHTIISIYLSIQLIYRYSISSSMD